MKSKSPGQEIGGLTMSLADKIFVTMCQDILENGTSTEGEKGTAALGGWYKCLYDQEIRCGEPL